MNQTLDSQKEVLSRSVDDRTEGSSRRLDEQAHKHHKHRPNTVGIQDGSEFVFSLIAFVALAVIGAAVIAEMLVHASRL